MNKICSLEINGFRGIRELSLDLNQKNLLIYGENGTGKSSLIDALHYIFQGKTSLTHSNLNQKKFQTHIDFDTDDVNIGIVLTKFKGSFVKKLTGFLNEFEEQEKEFFNLIKKSNFILRRNQILEFIFTIPSERFKPIASILGFNNIEYYEKCLQRAKSKNDNAFNSKESQINSYKKQIEHLLEIVNFESSLKKINSVIKKYDFKEFDNFKEFVNFDFNKKLQIDEYKKEKNKNLQIISSELTNLSFNKILDNYDNIGKVHSELSDNYDEKEFNYQMFYEEGLKLDKILHNICPFCDETLSNEKIAMIRNKLTSFDNMKIKVNMLKASVKECKDNLIQYKNNLIQLKLFENLDFKESVNIDELITSIEKIIMNSDDTLKFDSKLKFVEKIQKDLILSIQDSKEEILNKINKYFKDNDTNEKINFIGNISAIQVKIRDLTKSEEDLIKISKFQKIYKFLYDKFHEIKKKR